MLGAGSVWKVRKCAARIRYGSVQRASARHSIGREIPLRIPAAHDIWYMDPRAEADWCPRRGREDGVVAGARRCEEWHLFGKCGSGQRVSALSGRV